MDVFSVKEERKMIYTDDVLYDSTRFSKIPKWAQKLIRDQEYEIGQLKQQVDEWKDEQPQSDMSWQYLLDSEHFVPPNSRVRLYWNQNSHVDVFFRNEGERRVLEINGTHRLCIEPLASNRCYIFSKE